MFSKKEHYSNDRILDPVSGIKVPVVLNPKLEVADPQLPARERANQYVRFIREQNARYCLFTPTGLKVSRVCGVSLSSQIEALAVKHQLEDESVLAQFGQTYYVANLSSGFVVSESLVPTEEFDSNDLGHTEVIALSGVKGALEMGIRVLDASLFLTGKGATRAHLFLPEVKAFSVAGYRHPAQIRTFAIVSVSVLTLVFSIYGYNTYQLEQKRLEQERRAAVIPPKVGKDSSVEQLRAYALWLRDNLDYYSYNGLERLEINGTKITLSGLVNKSSAIDFYEHHSFMGVLPTYQVLIGSGPNTVVSSNKTKWSVALDLQQPIQQVEQFGLEIYENYLVTLQSSLPRLGLVGTSSTPSLNAHGIKQGEFNLGGEYTSPKMLFDLANAMIGIPSYAQSIRLDFGMSDSTQMSVQMRIVGRG